MGCLRPLSAYRSAELNENGKRVLVFATDYQMRNIPPACRISVPCGSCLGCRMDRARLWAVRCMHEAKLHDESCFVTLTYNDESLPKDGCVSKREFQLFMKRLRKFYADRKIRFFGCGEYGESNGRPHYHILLFGITFGKNRVPGKATDSDALSYIWGKGFCTVGDVTIQSAAYVAGYCSKKVSSDLKGKTPPFILMSRGGRVANGIGKGWFDKYSSDVYPHGYLILPGGKKQVSPRYYDDKFKLTDLVAYDKLKKTRMLVASHSPDKSPDRLLVKEKVLTAIVSQKGSL